MSANMRERNQFCVRSHNWYDPTEDMFLEKNRLTGSPHKYNTHEKDLKNLER